LQCTGLITRDAGFFRDYFKGLKVIVPKPDVSLSPHPHPVPFRSLPMLQAYRQHAAERAALGIPPLPLDAKQVAELIELIKAPPGRRRRLPAGPADAPRAAGRGRRGQGQGQLPGRRGAR
jgi:hypothetical protein